MEEMQVGSVLEKGDSDRVIALYQLFTILLEKLLEMTRWLEMLPEYFEAFNYDDHTEP